MTKGEETRQKIIELAAPLFNQLGYAGCSMQDIMAATGLEKGGLYRHFSSKEELAEEAFRYSVSRVMNLRWDGVDEVEGAVEQVQFMVRRFVEVRSTIPGGCPVMNTAIEADDGNPVLRKLAREALQQWKQKIATIVEAGIERKEIKADVEPRRIANSVIAALEGAQMISRLEGSSEAMHDAKAMLDTFLTGLRPATKRR
ncbi:TetR/AcrR family transcriptional regulator [Occallatibacter riparius]|uniref:TetR/AcrR family transcriptional regulator n=1 Tax=Occallatibacter riparius TaxID=1002689 RepID=A0A9J7BZ28_9BACT|nr:TetR/AcrR family transcriptional regulator [Occallatibacter riparius]UWZ86790.1 TetR/AcrR family transcriptional regulator [Occallatibacter riparius]